MTAPAPWTLSHSRFPFRLLRPVSGFIYGYLYGDRLESFFLHGMGVLPVVASQTFASSGKTSEERQANFGWFTTSASAGQLLGPLIGGAIADAFSYRIAFAVGGWACLPAAGFALLLKKTSTPSGTYRGQLIPEMWQIRRLLRKAGIKAAMASSFGVLFAMGLRSSFFPVYLHQKGFGATAVGANLSVRALTSMLVRPFLPLIVRLVGRSRVLVLMIFLAALGLGLTPFVDSIFDLAVLAVCIGVGVGLCQPLSMLAVADNTGDEERGLALGLRLTSNRLAQVTNPLMFGLVAQFMGLEAAFVAGGGVLLLTALLLLRWRDAFEPSDEGATDEVMPSSPEGGRSLGARQ